MTTTHRKLLPIAAIVLLAGIPGCAPRSSGVQARKEANARFNQTTSLVSYDQAKQAFESGELEVARREIEKALTRSDKEAKYWALLGRVELESKRLEKAVQAFGRAIECDPDFPESYYYRAIVYQRWSENEKAIADYLMASQLAPDKVSYLLAAAELMVAAKQLDEARTLLLSKLAYFEHNPALHELLGDTSALAGDHAAAARSYERALVIDPDAPMLAEKVMDEYFAAGEWQRCLDSARRQREAAQIASDGLRAQPPKAALRFEGRSLLMLGRTTDARAVFTEHTRLFAEDVDAWIDLGTVCLELDDLPRAEAAAERVMTLAQNDARGFALRGLIETARGNTAKALEFHRLAFERAPTDTEVRVAYGLALRAAGKRAEAQVILSEALKADPESDLAKQAFAQGSLQE